MKSLTERDKNHPKRDHSKSQGPKRMPIPASMRSNRNLIGIVFYNFCKQTTVHGVNRLSSVRNHRNRVFWILIVCGATLGFTINLVNIVEKYLQYQVLSNVYHDEEIFEFPEISFCNLNPIYVPPSSTPDYKKLIERVSEFLKVKKNRNLASYFLSGLIDYMFIQRIPFSHPGWSFIAQCKYQGSHCDWNNFDKISLWPYGNCYTFNPMSMNKTRLVEKSVIYKGYRPNFEVILYKAIDFPPELKMDFHNMLSMPSGILLMLHEPESYPYIFEGTPLDFFSVVDMRITRKFHEPRLKPCIQIRDNFTYFDSVTNVSKKYVGRWADCLYSIVQKEVVKSCNCVMELYPIEEEYQNLHFCKAPLLNISTKAFHSCLSHAFEEIQRLEGHMNSCYRDLCTHSSYATVISQAKYPAVEERNSETLWISKLAEIERNEIKHFGKSDLSRKALRNNPDNLTLQKIQRHQKHLLDIDFVNRNFMFLRVVPQSLFMDKVEEVDEYPLSRLLSDIGGCVGLWLGASLITIFELFDLIMDSIEIFCNNPYYRYMKMAKANFQNRQNTTYRCNSKQLDLDNDITRRLKESITGSFQTQLCSLNKPECPTQMDNNQIMMESDSDPQLSMKNCNLISSV